MTNPFDPQRLELDTAWLGERPGEPLPSYLQNAGQPTPPPLPKSLPTIAFPGSQRSVVHPSNTISHPEHALPGTHNLMASPFAEFGDEAEPHQEQAWQERFADPRDDLRLRWANGRQPWFHQDVEARMVKSETLWVFEKLEEYFGIYIKPLWWDRFVEGLNDLFGSVYKELIRPVFQFLMAPFDFLLIDFDWPWNFELRGEYVSIKQNPFRRLVYDSRLSQDVVERMWDDPDRYVEAGQTLSRYDPTTVSRVPLRAPGTTGRFPKTSSGVLKRFNLTGFLSTFTRMLWFSRASRSWTYGRHMIEAGIGTGQPLAMVEDRVGPLRFRSFVLNEFVEGTPLDQFLERTPVSKAELDQLASQFAHIWHTLRDLRIVHHDLKPANLLVTPDRQLKVIDLDSAWRHWFDFTFLPCRDRDWLRFMRGWKGNPEISAAFRAAVARQLDNYATGREEISPPVHVRWQRAA